MNTGPQDWKSSALTTRPLLSIWSSGNRNLPMMTAFFFCFKDQSELGEGHEGIQGLFWKIRACVRYNLKRAKRSSKRAQLWIFATHFFKFRAFVTLHPPKQHVFLEFSVENKAFYFTKRALCADTARNKWLK